MPTPGCGELIQEGLDLVDADGDVAGIVEALALGYALEDVGEVVDQLADSEGDLRLLHHHTCLRWVLRLEGEKRKWEITYA